MRTNHLIKAGDVNKILHHQGPSTPGIMPIKLQRLKVGNYWRLKLEVGKERGLGVMGESSYSYLQKKIIINGP